MKRLDRRRSGLFALGHLEWRRVLAERLRGKFSVDPRHRGRATALSGSVSPPASNQRVLTDLLQFVDFQGPSTTLPGGDKHRDRATKPHESTFWRLVTHLAGVITCNLESVAVHVEGQLNATIVAPYTKVDIQPGIHRGEVRGYQAELHQRAIFYHRPFQGAWSK